MVKSEGLPSYMKKGWKEKRWQRFVKFRLGSGIRGNRYWEIEEKRKCRICQNRIETWERVWEECGEWGREKGWQEMAEKILEEEGEGEEWLRKLEEIREEKVIENDNEQ